MPQRCTVDDDPRHPAAVPRLSSEMRPGRRRLPFGGDPAVAAKGRFVPSLGKPVDDPGRLNASTVEGMVEIVPGPEGSEPPPLTGGPTASGPANRQRYPRSNGQRKHVPTAKGFGSVEMCHRGTHPVGILIEQGRERAVQPGSKRAEQRAADDLGKSSRATERLAMLSSGPRDPNRNVAIPGASGTPTPSARSSAPKVGDRAATGTMQGGGPLGQRRIGGSTREIPFGRDAGRDHHQLGASATIRL